MPDTLTNPSLPPAAEDCEDFELDKDESPRYVRGYPATFEHDELTIYAPCLHARDGTVSWSGELIRYPAACRPARW